MFSFLGLKSKGKSSVNSAISRCITNLSNTNANIRLEATNELSSLISESDANKKAVAEAGGLVPLVKLLRDADTKVKKAAVEVLAQLSNDDTNQAAIAEAGGIIPLMNLLGVSDTDIKHIALIALVNFANNNTNKSAIIGAGGIVPLVNLLNYNNDQMQMCSVLLLWSISANVVTQIEIARAGGFIPLIRLLTNENTTVRMASVGILRNLSINEENQTAIVNLGGIVLLVNLLSDLDAGVKQHAVCVIKNLVNNRNEENKKMVANAGGIVPLVDLLSDKNEEVRINAVISLMQLLKDNSAHQKILVNSGLMPVLQRMVGTESHPSVKKFIEEIFNFCQMCANSVNEAIRNSIANLSNENVNTRLDATNELSNLIYQNEGIKKEVVAARGVLPLVKLLRDNDTRVRKAAAGVLCNLTTGAENEARKIAVAEVGGVVHLVNLLGDSDTGIRQLALGAILNFLQGSEASKVTVTAAGGLVPLVHLLSDNDDLLKHNSVAALYFLSENVTNKTAIVRAGSLSPLVRMLSDSNTLVKQYSSGVMKNISTDDEENQIAIASVGSILPLVNLLSDLDYIVRVNAVCAINNLVNNKNEVNKKMVADAGGILPLVNLLSDENENVRINAVIALIQILKDNSQNKTILVNAGLMPVLQRVSRTESNQGVRELAKEIFDFCQPFVEQRQAQNFQGTPTLKMPIIENLTENVNRIEVNSPSSPLSNLETIASHELVIKHELGRGTFGVVSEALWQTVNRVAVKQLLGQLTNELIDEFKRETNVHASLRHPNIIALYGVCMEATKYALVMEFMANGSLYDILHSAEELPWSLRLSIALDVVSGILYLHNKNIVHRDLKSLNILMDEHMRAKVSDFGLAKIKHTTATMTKGGMGSLYWMAPELFENDGVCNKTTDVYATGMVLWEVASRELPYKNQNQAQIILNVGKGVREPIAASAPPKFAILISRCWAQRAEDRPLMRDVAQDMNNIKQNTAGLFSAESSNSSVLKSDGIDSDYMQFSKR